MSPKPPPCFRDLARLGRAAPAASLAPIGDFRALDEAGFIDAGDFIFRKWRERASERGEPVPLDLSRSCKYGSLFMSLVYGGTIAGNYQHQFNIIDGRIVDLSHAAADVFRMREPYAHDADLFVADFHRESMASITPRVSGWVEEFLARDED
ncbi:transcriptional regulator [Derxia gummosa]|uniref:Transcriptional regulator n=1 Tax=Derxia gummosa DSM 723 TaxID=1121388 RepID=A0A8B6XBV3_9BURK|nr:transcriptional regulator [Derxia gummosa]